MWIKVRMIIYIFSKALFSFISSKSIAESKFLYREKYQNEIL